MSENPASAPNFTSSRFYLKSAADLNVALTITIHHHSANLRDIVSNWLYHMTTLRAYLCSVRLSILCAGYREYSTDAAHLIQ